MDRYFDVVIVGGRCAGAALARLLATSGLRTLIIDRATFPSDTVSTHSITGHGTRLLNHWGLLDAAVATGAPVRQAARFTTGEHSFLAAMPDDGHGYFAPRRTVLDALLVDAARKAGAEVWEATTFLGVERDAATVTGVRCRRADGETVVVHAAVVVGADGAHSAVADAVGAPAYRVRPSAASGVYAYYENTGLTEFEFAFAPAGSSSLCPPTTTRYASSPSATTTTSTPFDVTPTAPRSRSPIASSPPSAARSATPTG
jgi:2-polyprenyl-6-methoxyphenol hydroxylase-like FAD-dependent oxidoreductase